MKAENSLERIFRTTFSSIFSDWFIYVVLPLIHKYHVSNNHILVTALCLGDMKVDSFPPAGAFSLTEFRTREIRWDISPWNSLQYVLLVFSFCFLRLMSCACPLKEYNFISLSLSQPNYLYLQNKTGRWTDVLCM